MWLADVIRHCPGASPGPLTWALRHSLVSPEPSAQSNASSNSLTFPIGWDVPLPRTSHGTKVGVGRRTRGARNPRNTQCWEQGRPAPWIQCP